MPLSTFCHRGNAGEETLSRFIPDGGDLTDGEFYLLPKGGLQEIYLHTVRRRIGRSGVDAFERVVCAPEDVQDQIDTTNKCYREYRETTGVPWY